MENNIKKDDFYSINFSFTQEQVVQFAEASGDKNPIHLDAEYAKTTIFKRQIIHGFLGGSIFSKVFGTIFPGNGTIYLSQNMKFMQPMYVDTIYQAHFLIKEIIPGKHRALCETRIVEASDKDVIVGEALIQHYSISLE